MQFFADPGRCLWAVTTIASYGLLISTLQTLWNWRLFRPDGLMSWELFKTRPRFAKYAASPLIGALYTFPNFLYVIALQGVAALLLLGFPGHGIIRPVALTAILIIFLFSRLRHQPYGMVGADSMNLLVFGALGLREIAPDTTTQGCLWFIAFQSCLSYSTNGMLKLASPHWRRGKVLWHIAHHALYGSARLARVLRAYPAVGKWLDWSVIGCELAFPFVLLVGHPACWIFLGWGLLFHMLTAVVMGLNTFLFAWAATYPAIVFMALHYPREPFVLQTLWGIPSISAIQMLLSQAAPL
jgi:hypothetical protein